MLNPAVLKPLWVKQTSKWLSLGESYLNSIVDKTTEIATRILCAVAMDINITMRTKAKLEKVIEDFGVAQRKKVTEQHQDLVHKHATLALHTNNPQFIANVRKARSMRFEQALERYRLANPPVQFLTHLFSRDNQTFAAGPEAYDRWAIVDDDSALKLFNEIHPYGQRSQNTEDEIHDLLKSYYDVSYLSLIHSCTLLAPIIQISLLLLTKVR